MSRIVARRARIPRRCGWCTPGDSPRKVIEGAYLVKGEFYPCKPDIFWATYEVVAP